MSHYHVLNIGWPPQCSIHRLQLALSCSRPKTQLSGKKCFEQQEYLICLIRNHHHSLPPQQNYPTEISKFVKPNNFWNPTYLGLGQAPWFSPERNNSCLILLTLMLNYIVIWNFKLIHYSFIARILYSYSHCSKGVISNVNWIGIWSSLVFRGTLSASMGILSSQRGSSLLMEYLWG